MSARRGFTLIEAMLAVAALSMLAAGVAVLYASGQRSLVVQAEEIVFCSALRSAMEEVVAKPFNQLSSGTANLVVAGRTVTRTTTVSPVDLDGDAVNETNAVAVTVTLDGRSASLLIVDGQGRVGKH